MINRGFWVLFICLFASSHLLGQRVRERTPFGALSIIQGATNETQTEITVIVPRLKKYRYFVEVKGKKRVVTVEPTREIRQKDDDVLWKIEKVKITGLQPGEEYVLRVLDEKYDEELDRRVFSALDTQKEKLTFIFGSCMSDDIRMENIRNQIWDHVPKHKPDFMILNGDLVYVDGFEFVARQAAGEKQMWQRYLESTQKMPIYRQERLIPVFATWDDHDAGTDNADRNFKGIKEARSVFKAFFGSDDIPGFYENAKDGVHSIIRFGSQRFFLLDGRSFRAPDEGTTPEPFAQYGKPQTDWIFANLAKENTPAWLIQGDQFFANKVVKPAQSGRPAKTLNESYKGKHPTDFQAFLDRLKPFAFPIVFGSGDIHFSEVMLLGPEWIGRRTVEVTSSPIHSFIYFKSGVWNNELRDPKSVVQDHNFAVIQSERTPKGDLKIGVKFIGADGNLFFDSCYEALSAASAISKK